MTHQFDSLDSALNEFLWRAWMTVGSAGWRRLRTLVDIEGLILRQPYAQTAAPG